MAPSTLERLKCSVAEWQEMKETGEGFAVLADEQIKAIRGKLFSLEAMIKLFSQVGFGLTMKQRNREAWGILTEDASDPGRYRWTQFQRDGFTGHCTHDTPELCLGDMVDEGYIVPDQGALDRLYGTPEWERGTRITAIIQACNAGLMSWEEANRQASEIKQLFLEVA